MEDKKQFLDYEGFKLYHNELLSRLRDLEYDPQRMFDSVEDLLTLSNWTTDTYGRIFGLKEGLIVTVDNKFWQLVNPAAFKTIITRIGETVEEKAQYDIEILGWKVVGSTTEFDIDGHTLKLIK